MKATGKDWLSEGELRFVINTYEEDYKKETELKAKQQLKENIDYYKNMLDEKLKASK